MKWGPIGLGFITAGIVYTFIGIIISIFTGGNKEQQTGVLVSPSEPVEYHPYPEDTSERVVEREILLVRRTPPQCFKCGADINPEEVD